MIRVIVFDFDGVIVDSNRLKQESLLSIFEGSGVKEDIVREVESRTQGTRFDILRDIFVRSGKNAEEVAALTDEYAKRFDDAVQRGIAEYGMIPGTREALAELGRSYALYVNSMTPQAALEKTISHLGIHSFFKRIYGWPPEKTENLKNIIAAEGRDSAEVMMVGDGEGDIEAAERCGCPFVGVANDFNQWKNKRFPLIRAIAELGPLVAKNV